MPSVNCKKCGYITNTAVSEVDDFKYWGKYADRCFVRVDKTTGKWIEGCVKPDNIIMKRVINGLIGTSAVQNESYPEK